MTDHTPFQEVIARLQRWRDAGDTAEYGIGDLRFERDVLSLLELVTTQQEALEASDSVIARGVRHLYRLTGFKSSSPAINAAIARAELHSHQEA